MAVSLRNKKANRAVPLLSQVQQLSKCVLRSKAESFWCAGQPQLLWQEAKKLGTALFGLESYES